MWCLWHYRNNMATEENTWTCNTSRDKGHVHDVRASVSLLCVEGAVWGAGEEKASLHSFLVNWVGERQTNTCPLPFPLAFYPFPFLYIPCALLSSYSSLQWNIREGMDSVPETRSCTEEPSVMLSLTDRFLEQEGEIGSHHWDTLGKSRPFPSSVFYTTR